MFSTEQLGFVQKKIEASDDKDCLKALHVDLSRIDTNHIREETCARLIKLFISQNAGLDHVILCDLQDLHEDFDLETIEEHIRNDLPHNAESHELFFFWAQLQRLSTLKGDIEKRSPLRKQLNQVKRWVTNRITALTPTKKISRRGSSRIPLQDRAPTPQERRLSRDLSQLRKQVEQGNIDVQAIQECADKVSSTPSRVRIFQLMLLLSDANRAIEGRTRHQFIHGEPKHRSLVDPQTIIGLSHMMLRMRPDTIRLSAMMIGLARMELYKGPMEDYGFELAQNRHRADCFSLGNGLWSLAKHETGKPSAALLAEELCTRIELNGNDMPNRVTIVSALWSTGVLSLKRDYAVEFLDYAKCLIAQLNPSEVARCFQAAAYFQHDVSWWKASFDAAPAVFDTWYNRDAENAAEQELHEMVQAYLQRHGIPAEVQKQGFLYGLECDNLVTFRDGTQGVSIDIEFDGGFHAHQKGSDAYRDGVLNTLGDRVIRINGGELKQMRGDLSAQDRLLSPIFDVWLEVETIVPQPREVS